MSEAWRAQGELGRTLGSFAESTSISHSYSFLIFKWAEVVEALLRLQATTRAVPLAAGTVSIVIEDYGTIVMTVPIGSSEGTHSTVQYSTVQCSAVQNSTNPHVTTYTNAPVISCTNHPDSLCVHLQTAPRNDDFSHEADYSAPACA